MSHVLIEEATPIAVKGDKYTFLLKTSNGYFIVENPHYADCPYEHDTETENK